MSDTEEAEPRRDHRALLSPECLARIAELVAAAPPFSPETEAKLRALLRPAKPKRDR